MKKGFVSSSLFVPSSAGGMDNGSRVREWEEAGETDRRSNCPPLLSGLSKVSRPALVNRRGFRLK